MNQKGENHEFKEEQRHVRMRNEEVIADSHLLSRTSIVLGHPSSKNI